MEATRRALMLNVPHQSGSDDVAGAVHGALQDLQMELMPRAEVVASGGPPSVTEAIQKADIIVADVSQPPPNVLYELGYAHALRKPTLLLLNTEASASLPSDLTGYQVLTYSPQNLAMLRRQIQRFIEHQMLRLAY